MQVSLKELYIYTYILRLLSIWTFKPVFLKYVRAKLERIRIYVSISLSVPLALSKGPQIPKPFLIYSFIL